MKGKTTQEKSERLANVGTIDLRIDYLRPDLGKYFIVSGSILRAGNKVTVTRMELHNDEDAHIAVGTGAYLVG
jgi:acyl-coenzyme A thioesterase PaaI-like protein